MELNQVLEKSDEFVVLLNSYLMGVLNANQAHIGIIGCIYYSHDYCSENLINLKPDLNYQHKRERLAAIARRYEIPRVLEVGINAGHSAVILLLSNENLIYYGIDNAKSFNDGKNIIRSDIYVPAAVDLLKLFFVGRVDWSKGSSWQTLNRLALLKDNFKKYNILHLDAQKELYYQDFISSLPMLESGATIVVDDTAGEGDPASKAVERLISEGYCEPDNEFPERRANTILKFKG